MDKTSVNKNDNKKENRINKKKENSELKLIAVLFSLTIFSVLLLFISDNNGKFIEGEKSRIIHLQSDMAYGKYNLELSDSIGKMAVTYTSNNKPSTYIVTNNAKEVADTTYCAIIVEKPNVNKANTYIIEGNSLELVNFTYGAGEYKIKICEVTDKNKLKVIEEKTITVGIKDNLAPFKGSSYYTIKLSEDEMSDIPKDIKGVYRYICDNFTYDTELANSITSGEVAIYKPNILKVLKAKKGICLDNACLMASILRSRGIPTKIAVGDYEGRYHAWVEVYEKGVWKIYDPTNRKSYTDGCNKSYTVQQYY